MLQESRLWTDFQVMRDCPVLRVNGTLDAQSAPTFRHDVEELFSAGYKNMLMDFAGLKFLDSSGLGTLLYLFQSLREQGGHELWIAGCNNMVQTLLKVTHLDQKLRCFDSLPHALDAWKATQGGAN